MPMNKVIQEKRRELGLTQEQLAQHLGVSTPAVSKWEKGITCPDIAILPNLARLLKVDLNTLFCFQEELTNEDVVDFTKELCDTIDEEGLAAAFEQAEKMIGCHPHNENLIFMVTSTLSIRLIISGLTEPEAAEHQSRMKKWFLRLAESEDPFMREHANSMLAELYMGQESWTHAQTAIDAIADNPAKTAHGTEKMRLRTELLIRQGKADEAAEELEKALLDEVGKVQDLLLQLAKAEMAAEEPEKAERIIKLYQDTTSAFDLWEPCMDTELLPQVMERKDVEQTMSLIQRILSAAEKPWERGGSPLYHRIDDREEAKYQQIFVVASMCAIFRDTEAEFLRSDERFSVLAQAADNLLVGMAHTSKEEDQ